MGAKRSGQEKGGEGTVTHTTGRQCTPGGESETGTVSGF